MLLPITGAGLGGVQWHPDGERLTYTEKRPGEEAADLWAFELDSGRRERLLEGKALAGASTGASRQARPSLDGYQ